MPRCDCELVCNAAPLLIIIVRRVDREPKTAFFLGMEFAFFGVRATAQIDDEPLKVEPRLQRTRRDLSSHPYSDVTRKPGLYFLSAHDISAGNCG